MINKYVLMVNLLCSMYSTTDIVIQRNSQGDLFTSKKLLTSYRCLERGTVYGVDGQLSCYSPREIRDDTGCIATTVNEPLQIPFLSTGNNLHQLKLRPFLNCFKMDLQFVEVWDLNSGFVNVSSWRPLLLKKVLKTETLDMVYNEGTILFLNSTSISGRLWKISFSSCQFDKIMCLIVKVNGSRSYTFPTRNTTPTSTLKSPQNPTSFHPSSTTISSETSTVAFQTTKMITSSTKNSETSSSTQSRTIIRVSSTSKQTTSISPSITLTASATSPTKLSSTATESKSTTTDVLTSIFTLLSSSSSLKFTSKSTRTPLLTSVSSTSATLHLIPNSSKRPSSTFTAVISTFASTSSGIKSSTAISPTTSILISNNKRSQISTAAFSSTGVSVSISSPTTSILASNKLSDISTAVFSSTGASESTSVYSADISPTTSILASNKHSDISTAAFSSPDVSESTSVYSVNDSPTTAILASNKHSEISTAAFSSTGVSESTSVYGNNSSTTVTVFPPTITSTIPGSGSSHGDMMINVATPILAVIVGILLILLIYLMCKKERKKRNERVIESPMHGDGSATIIFRNGTISDVVFETQTEELDEPQSLPNYYNLQGPREFNNNVYGKGFEDDDDSVSEVTLTPITCDVVYEEIPLQNSDQTSGYATVSELYGS